MNQTEQWEKRLRAWQPRRPSLKSSKRLFPNADESISWCALFSRWAMPAAACLFFFMNTVGPGRNGFLRDESSEVSLGIVLSNQSVAAFYAGDTRNDQNTLRNTFEWTNRSEYSPSIRSLGPVNF